jgi:high-affinity iron transporter
MLPTFVIFLREGIEASMIVAILLSYLKQIGKRSYFRTVFAGVFSAFALIFAGGISAYYLIDNYNTSNIKTYFETVTYVIAAVALTGMTFWMKRHAATISQELRSKSDIALSSGSRFGIAVLAFQAVGREGLETMVFTLAILFATSRPGLAPAHGSLLWLGALLGLALALVIAFAIYKLGAKINLRVFFRVLGVTLMFFAAGLVVDAIQNMQALGWLGFGQHVLWNTSGALAEGSNLGDVLHSFLGYAERPTALQGVAYVLYVAIALTYFLRTARRTRS